MINKNYNTTNKDSGYIRNGKHGEYARRVISLEETNDLECFCMKNNLNYQEHSAFVNISKKFIKECNYDNLNLIKEFQSYPTIPFLPFKY